MLLPTYAEYNTTSKGGRRELCLCQECYYYQATLLLHSFFTLRGLYSITLDASKCASRRDYIQIFFFFKRELI